MSARRAPCTFRQTDVTRALDAAGAAGFEKVRVHTIRRIPSREQIRLTGPSMVNWNWAK
jgi:hypothetical protein